MVGILVHGDNHFIVRGPMPNREIALDLVRHWSLIQIGGTTPPHLQPWTISTREFRENLEWAIVVSGSGEHTTAVSELLREISARGVAIETVNVREGGGYDPTEIVVAYHERTKHHYHRYAASTGFLDWANQPDPFRRYQGSPLIRLPMPGSGHPLPYWKLYVPQSIPPAALSVESISLFFRYSLSLTAVKQLREVTWALRANPSSGNLHPTEAYALLPPIEGIHNVPGLFHYAAKEHGLELRADLDAAAFPQDSFLVGLSSIHWREAWKYGERAFRYCQHDAGHALGSLRIAAAALGWKLRLLDDGVQLLGLDREEDYQDVEREHADFLAIVSPGSTEFRSPAAATRWYGKANLLSREHVDWPVIDRVANATTYTNAIPVEKLSGFPCEEELFAEPVRTGTFTAEKVILGRRSAVSMDGTTSISASAFFRMMGRLVPTRDGRSIPWDAITWRPRIHLGLFVHRVDGLAPGLYMLVRDPEKLDSLRQAMRHDFVWQRPPSCPHGLPLYLLKEGDCRTLSARVSCGQDIAADGAFSLGMIAEYLNSLVDYGAGFYRNLFWEAGLVGQVLYLEAEEAGIRATGIGCYFDDPVHEVFGIATRDWQSLYHFTVGGPVEDRRLTTLPPYDSHVA